MSTMPPMPARFIWKQRWFYLAILGGVLAICFLVTYLLQWTRALPESNIPLTAKDKFEIVNGKRDLLVKAFGGLFFLVTAVFTYRTVRATERTAEIAQKRLEDDRAKYKLDKEILEAERATERFIKATGNLANDKIAARVGAVYSLDIVAREFPQHHRRVFETLNAFVFESSREKKRGLEANKTHLHNTIDSFPASDVLAAMAVIWRRNMENDSGRVIELSGSYLPRISFDNTATAEVRQVIKNAAMTYCYLCMSIARYCDFQDVLFSHSNMTGVSFYNSTFDNVDFAECILTNTNFKSADLSKAMGLTQEQIDKAIGNIGKGGTVLPEGLLPPPHWKEAVATDD